MHVVIFEGSHWSDFIPFSLTKPVFCLRSGTCTLLEKQLRATRPSRVTLWIRDEMVEYVQKYVIPTIHVPTSINTPLDDEPALIFASRTLHFSRFERPAQQCVVLEEEDQLIRLAYASMPGLTHNDVMNRDKRWLAVRDLPQAMPQTRFPRNWADLVAWNEESIMSDSIYWNEPAPEAKDVTLINPEDIHSREGVSIGASTVLDASKGPILLDQNVSIGANCVIEGPVYIGPGSRVSPLSIVRPGTSVGGVCRIGGEVGNSIFQNFSNKSHEGFVGDSYVGEWVNMGAGTTTSNLKSTYGLIKLRLGGSKEVQSERVLLGCAVGDYAKTATHTQLQAGAYVGVASMVSISQRVPHIVPSFQFWTDESRDPMPVNKAAEVAVRMCSRRAQTFNEVDQRVLEYAAKAAAELKA